MEKRTEQKLFSKYNCKRKLEENVPQTGTGKENWTKMLLRQEESKEGWQKHVAE